MKFLTISAISPRWFLFVPVLNSNLDNYQEIPLSWIANNYLSEVVGNLNYCQIQNGVCFLQVLATTKVNYSGWVKIYQLPVKPRLNKEVYAPTVDSAGLKNFVIRIDISGGVYLSAVGTANSTTQYANLAFPCVEIN